MKSLSVGKESKSSGGRGLLYMASVRDPGYVVLTCHDVLVTKAFAQGKGEGKVKGEEETDDPIDI